uniref:Uncharacterized protein n=1 Tax=Helianthus annuus TaxID=4232 RepID=A0A251UR01_HELAN
MFSTFRSCFFRRDLIFQNELASCKDKDSEDFRIQETIFSYLLQGLSGRFWMDGSTD